MIVLLMMLCCVWQEDFSWVVKNDLNATIENAIEKQNEDFTWSPKIMENQQEFSEASGQPQPATWAVEVLEALEENYYVAANKKLDTILEPTEAELKAQELREAEENQIGVPILLGIGLASLTGIVICVAGGIYIFKSLSKK